MDYGILRTVAEIMPRGDPGSHFGLRRSERCLNFSLASHDWSWEGVKERWSKLVIRSCRFAMQAPKPFSVVGILLKYPLVFLRRNYSLLATHLHLQIMVSRRIIIISPSKAPWPPSNPPPSMPCNYLTYIWYFNLRFGTSTSGHQNPGEGN